LLCINSGFTGATGPFGPSGPPGPFGFTGQSGVQGETGDPGFRGLMGVTGATGAPGASGFPGRIGGPGKNCCHCTVFSARCNIYISRLCYNVSVRLSVRLSVTEVHCGHGACWEEGRGHLTLC